MTRSLVLKLGLVLALGFTGMHAAAAQQRSLGSFGDWTAVADGSGSKKLCYVGTVPKKAEGKYTSRGDIHLLVTHRPAEKVTAEVSIATGYTYADGKDATVEIDGKSFKLFTRGDNAWAYDAAADREIVAAMKAGQTMIVRASSRRGTVTTDTYSLAGFSAAMKAIDEACK